ncbi:MAG TPA: hypothetical protein P5287_00255 [bacterium]|nr:hypothetical protein [bacterium]
MQQVKPIYKKLLIAAIVLYVAGMSFMLCDLYTRVTNLQHMYMHGIPPHTHQLVGVAK